MIFAMYVLAADTSTSFNTVALCRDQALLAESTVDAGRKHSERLLETVDWVLSEAAFNLSQLDLLAIAVGPGSFTGLRVGLATWKGLALAARRPLIGVSTLDALVRLAPRDQGQVCPLLDAKMNEVFGAIYSYEDRRATKTFPDTVCSVDTILDELEGDPLFLGDGASKYRDHILERLPDAIFAEPGCDMPRAWAVAHEAIAAHHAGAPGNAAEVIPVYLRKSQPEQLRERRKPASVPISVAP